MSRMRARAPGLLASACIALAMGCARPEPDVLPVEVRIGAGDARCRPSSIRASRVSVVGDFSPEPTDTVELLTANGVRDLEGLRPSLRALRVEVDGEPSYRAIGGATIEDVRALGVVAVLPPRIPCALVDPDAYAPEGAALLAHPDGSAWVIGGGGDARRVARIDARLAFADVRPDALFNRREGASATVFGRDVIVAGGAAGPADTAHDSFERLDATVAAPEGALGGRLSASRRDHAAVLAGSRLVLVGGRGGGAADALAARIDVIDLADGSAALGPALASPRVAPTAFLASTGAVFVAGGRALDGAPVTSIERIEPGLDRVRTLEVSLPPAELVLGLPLDRLLHVSGAEVRIIDLRADPPRVELAARATELRAPHGAVTPAGRVVLSGTTASGRRLVELWTPHLGSVQTLELGRGSRTLLALEGSVVLEIDGSGAALRALEEPGPWSSLPNDRLLFPSDLGSAFAIATLPGDLDGARATRAGVRLAVSAMTLGELSITLEGSGARVLILRDAGDPTLAPLEVALDAEGNAFGPGCMLSRGEEPVVLSRSGARVELVRGAARARCDDVQAGALFHVEVQLERDAEVRELRVTRRAS